MSETVIAMAQPKQETGAATLGDEELVLWLAEAGLDAAMVASCPVPGCEVCDPRPQVIAA